MTVQIITAKEAKALLNKLGLEVNDDARTFYAKNENNDGVWKFESKAKRDEFVRKVNKKSKELSVRAKAYTLEALSHHNSKTAIEVMRSVNSRLYLENRDENQTYGWHEYSEYLQDLEAKGLIHTQGTNLEGMTRYMVINTNEQGETK